MVATSHGIAILICLNALVLGGLFGDDYQCIFFAQYLDNNPDLATKQKALPDELCQLCVHGEIDPGYPEIPVYYNTAVSGGETNGL